MKLFFQKTGEGDPLVILHGLFGLGDNWATLARKYAASGFCVYTVDLRNHGRSPHSDVFGYEVMAADIVEMLDSEDLSNAGFVGHSMGGKVLMFLAGQQPGRISRMVISDIAPRYYPPHHESILSALSAVDLDHIKSRKEVEAMLRISMHDEATIQFLLKNLYWKTEDTLGWRFYLRGIEKNLPEIGKAFIPGHRIEVPVLFVRGELSGYVNTSDEVEISRIFSDSKIQTIAGAGHWIHAEKPAEFFEETLKFLTEVNS